jgi:hypothetical protein
MNRFMPAAALFSAALGLALVAGIPAGALAQTVMDYEVALEGAPIAPAAPAAVAQCRPLFNYVYTSIPGDDRTSIAVPLYSFTGASGEEIERKRSICAEAGELPVISFNTGSKEEIVTPPLPEQDLEKVAY